MKKDMNIVFKKLLEKYIKVKERDIVSRLKRANDKDFVFREIKREIAAILNWLKLEDGKKELLTTFLLAFKRGNDLNRTIDQIQDTYGHGIEDVKSFSRIVDGKAVPIYISEEEKRLKEFTLNDRKLIKYLIRVVANKEIQKRFGVLYEKATSSVHQKSSLPEAQIKWTGTKEDNKNEFVQLVYSLHKAGFINKGKGEITKITESLAEVFGIDLGKNWQSNHSASIHKAKHNYKPPVFNKIQSAYLQYTNDLIEEKRKKA